MWQVAEGKTGTSHREALPVPMAGLVDEGKLSPRERKKLEDGGWYVRPSRGGVPTRGRPSFAA